MFFQVRPGDLAAVELHLRNDLFHTWLLSVNSFLEKLESFYEPM